MANRFTLDKMVDEPGSGCMAGARELAEGLLLSLGYCVVYLLVWHLSVDQWYLPAGLRAASLLFMPYRRWPFLLG
ncbi:MASE1 domain-containing protein, partial [Xanthomonas vasicola]|uniref:MASE1 domain-containing protein n=1 Tax=Xanthomonas vasicola TaxID=56459 RepID=UPI0038AAC9D5